MVLYPPRHSRHSNLRDLLSGLGFLENRPHPSLPFFPVEDFKDVRVNFRVLWNANSRAHVNVNSTNAFSASAVRSGWSLKKNTEIQEIY